jgi:hypothetical protein
MLTLGKKLGFGIQKDPDTGEKGVVSVKNDLIVK